MSVETSKIDIKFEIEHGFGLHQALVIMKHYNIDLDNPTQEQIAIVE